jgi:hypothetical protein
MLRACFKRKEYIFPSGRKVFVRGYENRALDQLLRMGIPENMIYVDRSEVPEIWWLDSNNKKHRYFADIWIPSLNTVIEVKSSWTLDNRGSNPELRNQYQAKRDASIQAGYQHLLMLF